MRTESVSAWLACLALLSALACDEAVCSTSPGADEGEGEDTSGGGVGDGPRFEERTHQSLPMIHAQYHSMETRAGDFDGDGDLDLLIAQEWAPNALLLNGLVETGELVFDDASARLPQIVRDSEDIAIGDFDGDGDLDALVSSEDDLIDELYRNQLSESGELSFVGETLPVAGRSNAVLAEDIDGDGDLDLLLGNDGQNVALVNDGTGSFVDDTAARLPAIEDTTQDLIWGDIDGDGDSDLVVANEGPNAVLVNDGTGVFSAVDDALPPTAMNEETRNADLGDVDGDGDLDLVFANVAWQPNTSAQDRLLLNDGSGHFALPPAGGGLDGVDESVRAAFTLDADFGDLDGDGDLDLVLTQIPFSPYRALVNDGAGNFTDATTELFPPGVFGEGIEVEIADLDADGDLDLYFSALADGDRLLVAR